MDKVSDTRIPLLPCPFCGGEPTFVRFGSAKLSFYISCNHCGIQQIPGGRPDPRESWNLRKPGPASLTRPTDEEILMEAYKSGDHHIVTGIRALFNKGTPGHTCGVCNWTNVGCLNVGESGAPEWVCHGCLKRERDAAKREANALATSLYKASFQQDAPQWELLPDVAGIISQIDNMVAGLRQRRDEEVFTLRQQLADLDSLLFGGFVSEHVCDEGSFTERVRLALVASRKKTAEEVDRLREHAELTIKTIEQKSNNRGWKGLKLWERKLLACAYYALGRKAPH